MTRLIRWLAIGVAAIVAVLMLVVGLAFVPEAQRSAYVATGALVGVAGIAVAALGARVVSEHLGRPLRELLRSVEEDRFGREAADEAVAQPAEEFSPLINALRLSQAQTRASAEQLAQDSAQMTAVFDHMADGVLVLDDKEHIVLANPAARRVLRHSKPEGRRLPEVVRGSPALVEIARAATSTRTVSQEVDLYGVADQPRRWIQVSATRLPDGRRTLVLLQDVSERRRVEAARRDFVANVSHDLRTPIASLKALVDTLLAGALEDPVAGPDFLRRMNVEVDGLSQLMTDLLELARAESARLDLELTSVPAGELVRESVDRMLPYAERVGLRMVVAEEPAEDVSVRADRRRLVQVFSNLLDNAVKFTPPGGHIEAGARASGDQVMFWVADSGVGIHAENLVRVFERFYKADPSRTGGGTGLGLAISKHVVLAHGGAIWAESKGEGRGATFFFTLAAVATDAGIMLGSTNQHGLALEDV